jgi:hypothetical protein
MSEISSSEWAKAFDAGDVQKAAALNEALAAGAVLRRDRSTQAPTPAMPNYATVKEVQAAVDILADALQRADGLITALQRRVSQLEGYEGGGPPGIAHVSPLVAQYVEDRLWKPENDIDTLKRECMSYKGIYDENVGYPRGSVVTRHGSWWIAEHGVEAGEMPGHANTNWKLCVKRERAK